jgi:hypothetical protein
MPKFDEPKIKAKPFNPGTQVLPLPPAEPNSKIDYDFDTASVYRDFQYSGGIAIGISGSPDSVTYYSLISRPDDLVMNAADLDDGTIKQFRRINNFEIRVTENPTQTIDDSQNLATVQGTANLYPVLTPKIGDILVKAINTGRGNWGIFQVVEVQRLSQYEEPAWTINFQQVDYSNTARDPESDKYVVFEFDFEVENLQTGQNPLIPSITTEKNQNKKELLNELIQLYYNTFYDSEKGTFIVPTTASGTVYDPHVVKFWNSIIDHSKYHILKRPHEYPMENVYDRKGYLTIYDVYLGQTPGLVNNVMKVMVKLSTSFFSAEYLKQTLQGSLIDYVINPHTSHSAGKTSMFPDEEIKGEVKWVSHGKELVWVDRVDDGHDPLIAPIVVPWTGTATEPVHEHTEPHPEHPETHEKHKDHKDKHHSTTYASIGPMMAYPFTENYVFSSQFYKGVPTSLLEVLVTNVINKRTVLLKDVYVALAVLKKDKLLAQYYQLPFIISLLQVAR